MHVDPGRIHVGKPPRDVMAAAGKRPVRHAGDLDDGMVGINGAELEA
jgi:hypothetical protein